MINKSKYVPLNAFNAKEILTIALFVTTLRIVFLINIWAYVLVKMGTSKIIYQTYAKVLLNKIIYRM